MVHIEKSYVERKSQTPVRQLRVAELIKEVVAKAIAERQIDSKIFDNSLISVTKIKVSPDLQNATIFVSSFPIINPEELVDKLNQLAHRFRQIINHNVKLKFSPKVLFRYDDTLEEVSRINSLIDSINS